MKFLKAIDDWFKGFGVDTAIVSAWFAIATMIFLVSFVDLPYHAIFGYMMLLLPIFLPFVLFVSFYEKWMKYIHTDFAIKQGSALLEIRVPKEIFKTPEAMEQIFMQLYQKASPDNLVQGLWDGKSPPSYSFEIVSRAGALHFYVYAPKKKFKNMIETHFYAQYPGVEIREVDLDYTAEIPSSLEDHSLFGFHFGRNKQIGPPIRTYVDWGHLDFPKEEEKIDPIATTLEAFANVGPGEHMWLQFIISPNLETSFKTGTLHTSDAANKEFKAAIVKFMTGTTEKKDKDGKPIIGKNGKPVMEERKTMELSEHEKTLLNAMKRQGNKYLFNTTIRGLYIAKRESFNPDRIAMLAACMRSVDVPDFGSINPGRFRTDVDWPWWQNVGGKRVEAMKKKILKLYKSRDVDPFEVYGVGDSGDVGTVFSTEELATLWHLPSRTVTAPTIGRIESTRREAPSNLPI